MAPYAPAPGEVDFSFANQGLFTLGADVLPTDAYVRFVMPDAGGNVWAAGWATGNPVSSCCAANAVLVRLRADGVLDATFAGSGYLLDPQELVTAAFSGYMGLIVAPIAGDGAVWVEWVRRPPCKFPPNCGTDGITQRVDANGVVDKSYGDSGKSRAVLEYMADAVADSRGGIVLVGTSLGVTPPGSYTIQKGLARIDGQGRVDTEFAAHAAGALDCPGLPAQYSRDLRIALHPDGKLLVAQMFGNNLEAGSNRVCLSRINPDGTLDVSYGGTGRVQLDDPLVAFDRVTLLGLFGAADGSATIAFNKQVGDSLTSYSFIVIALTPQGAVDTTRFNRGYTGPTDSLIARAGAVAVQTDGKVLVSGVPGIGTAPSWQGIDATQPRLERLGLDGEIDPTFGPGGQGYQSLALSGHLLDAMHIQVADKSIFVSGSAQRLDGTVATSHRYFAIAKFVGDERLQP